MAKIYISSTCVDLKKEREAAAQAVRQLGHQAIAMEDYVASDNRPVDKCLQDVRSSDAYVGIFAWRYGFIPEGYDKSITHLEYEAAKKAGKPCLVFLMDNKALWTVEYVTIGKERKKIDRLRKELMNEYVVSFFKNTDQLSGLVSAAVSNLIFVSERSFFNSKSPEELIGTQLGKYVIREKLGRGGKGVVFKVMDTKEEREKAIKMIPTRIADSPLAFKDLKKELNTAACIIHPNVVKVMGLEEHDRHFFIVMEYIEGKNLEQILAETSTGKLEESKVIDIMQKIAKGLLEIHKKNVIHRDIKPANIMVTPENQVKILDFGISYQVTRSMTELVGEHQWQGTWPYMAPEQLSTRYGREDKQVDIWGFGVTMYQLLSGKFPFTFKDQIKDINENPYELEGVSAKTKNIVMKCLEKDRKKRFIDMEEVLAALKAISIKSREVGEEKRVVPVVPEPPPVTPMPGTVKEVREIDFGDGIIMVYIPPGRFTMGSNEYNNEKPPHEVYLDGYRIGKYEVTVKQFGLFVKDTGYVTQAEESGGALTWNGKNWEKKEGIDWKNPGFKQEDNHPVVCVTWNDALEYCKWLSGKKGDIFNLPTEAQWEKAARGTDGRKYPWGVREPDEILANFGDKIGKTTPIGSYPDGASPYGLLDMVGNVWEWCVDWYDPKYYKNAPKDNPTGPKSGTQRVQRGGSWVFEAKYLPYSFRGKGTPDICHYSVGFRLCQESGDRRKFHIEISKESGDRRKFQEVLKGNITKNNSLLTTLIDTYSTSNQNVQEKRIKSIEILWDSFLEIKNNIPAVISLIYDILLEEERNNLYNSDSGDNFRKRLRDISMEELNPKMQLVYEKVEKHRPFLGDELWFIFYNYYGIVMRSIYHMLKGRDQKKIEHWSKDSGIMQYLGIALSKEEMEYITKIEIESYRRLKDLFEQKILNEMIKVTSGIKITEDSLKQIKKFERALSVKPFLEK